MAVALRAIVLLVVAALVGSVVMRLERPLLYAIPIVWLSARASTLTPEIPLLFGVLLILLVTADSSYRTAVTTALSAFSSVALLMRFDLGVICLSAVVCFACFEWRTQRMSLGELGVVAVAFAIGLLALFPLVGGRLYDLPRFLYGSLEIVRGYGPAVSKPGPLAEMFVSGLAVLGVLGVAVFAPSFGVRRAAWTSSLPLFFAFKHGFVRQDHAHVADFLAVLCQVGVVLLGAYGLEPTRPRRLTAMLGSCCGLIILAWLVADFWGTTGPNAHPPLSHRSRLRSEIKAIVRNPRDVLGTHGFRDYAAAVTAARAQGMQQLAFPASLAELLRVGTVDVIPWDAAYADANRLEWKPRPVFQSYSVYTPWLDDLNALALAGPTGPRFILWERKTLGEHPFFLEPRTWREVMCRYAPRGRWSAILILERLPDPTCGPLLASGSATMRFGQALQIPADQRDLVVSLSSGLSPWGHLLALLFRPPILQIEIVYGDGTVTTFRFIAGTGEDGLHLGQLPRNLEEAIDMFRSNTGPEVRSVRLITARPSAYQPTVKVQYFRLGRSSGSSAPAGPGKGLLPDGDLRGRRLAL
jgi:hypothetical protein